jgi:hypothetical protein
MDKLDIDNIPGARADLLCFLVATVTASHTLTYEWRVDHLVDSCRIWLARNVVSIDWLDRVLLGQRALKIAKVELKAAGISIRQSDVLALFTAEMTLNHASTMVQKMMRVCKESL